MSLFFFRFPIMIAMPNLTLTVYVMVIDSGFNDDFLPLRGELRKFGITQFLLGFQLKAV